MPPDLSAAVSAADPAYDRLIAALALGEGFQFHIVVANGPRQVRALLAHIDAALPARRGGTAVRTVHIAPYETLPRDRAPDAEALIAHLDGELARLPPASANERLVVALDATPANAADVEEAAAWRRAFRHMNEQRNSFVRGLDAEFLLCLPPALEAPFAHEAADFWSIRGVCVTLAPMASLERSTEVDAASTKHDTTVAPTEIELATARVAAAEAPDDEWHQRRHMVLLNRYGDDRLNQRGDSTAALAAYREALSIAETLAVRDPANMERQRDLAVSHDRIGDVLVAQGDGPDALAAYRKGLAIAEALAARDPTNTQWQRDLSISHNKIGDVLVAQGDGPGALAAYRKGLAIVKSLATRDPANTQWQRDLSISHNKIGDVLRTQGDDPGALAAYRQDLAIAESLAARDPANPQLQRDLAVSHIKIGDVLVALGDEHVALASYRKGLAIAEALAARDPANTEWQRDLSVSYNKIGDVLVAQGDSPDALTAYRKALAIAEFLAARDPANIQWQRDLSVSHDRIGNVLVAQGDGPGALAAYRQSLAIAESLATRDPANAEWQRDLLVSHVKLAMAGDGREHYAQALCITEAMQAKGTLAPRDEWMIDELKRRLAE